MVQVYRSRSCPATFSSSVLCPAFRSIGHIRRPYRRVIVKYGLWEKYPAYILCGDWRGDLREIYKYWCTARWLLRHAALPDNDWLQIITKRSIFADEMYSTMGKCRAWVSGEFFIFQPDKPQALRACGTTSLLEWEKSTLIFSDILWLSLFHQSKGSRQHTHR